MKSTKLDKQTKTSINYFKKSDSLKIIGAILLVCGLFSLWLGWSFSFLGYILGVLLTPTGFVLFLVGSSGKISDDDIDSYITNKMADFEIDIDNNRSYQLKLLKHIKEIQIEGYEFPEDVMIKRLKSGSLRSSVFTRSKIRILSDRLYVKSRKISLIYDEEVENSLFEPKYDEIKSVSIERDQKHVTFNKSSYLVKTCDLVIITDQDEIRLPCIDAVTTDEIATAISRQMKIFSSAQSKNTSENSTNE